MAYGDLPNGAPHKPNKGKEGGACNRERCQAEPANWFNHGSYAWYCDDCRFDIQFDVVNHRGWLRDGQPKCDHQQFETREMMDARTASVDGRRMAEIENTGSVPQGTTSAVPSGASADAPTPSLQTPQGGDS